VISFDTLNESVHLLKTHNLSEFPSQSCAWSSGFMDSSGQVDLSSQL
jgi:hypothetical protein